MYYAQGEGSILLCAFDAYTVVMGELAEKTARAISASNSTILIIIGA